MRSSLVATSTLTLLLTLLSSTLAYPTFATSSASSSPHTKRSKSYSNPYPDVTGLKAIPPKDGSFPFVEPGPKDQRGPCPGLNVLANHGYIPRSGIATLDQLVEGMKEGFNLGEDLGTVLSAIAIVLSGNPNTMTISIGGPDSRVDSTTSTSDHTVDTVALFGRPRGLDSHNTFEGDNSLSREDYYLNHGDAHSWMERPYRTVSDLAKEADDDWGLPITHEAHYRRWLDSKTRNPAWYSMPASAILTTGASSFIARCFANGTYGRGGVTNAANVDPFFGAIPLNAERTKFTWVPERFAPKWFRSGEAYGLKLVLQDILETYLLHPEMLVFGGNREGKFVELEMVTPRSVDGLGCFLYNTQLANLPNQLSGATTTGVNLAINLLNSIIGPIFISTFGCERYVRNAQMEGVFNDMARKLGRTGSEKIEEGKKTGSEKVQ